MPDCLQKRVTTWSLARYVKNNRKQLEEMMEKVKNKARVKVWFKNLA